VGHDGGTIGQSAYLRVLPEHDLAVALLTNGGFTRDLYEILVQEVIQELTGVEMTRPITPPPEPPTVDIGRYEGTYERTGVRYEVERGEHGPRLRITSEHGVPWLDRPPEEHDLVSVRENVFAIRPPRAQTWQTVTFYELPDGSPYLHLGLRATPRVAR
jgi:hypothetical protein